MASGNDPANIPYIIVENGFYYVAYKEKVKVPEVVVSAKGVANGLSEEYNDGWDFGPDSYDPNSTASIPYTQTTGVIEAITYSMNLAVEYQGIVSGGYDVATTIILEMGIFYLNAPVDIPLITKNSGSTIQIPLIKGYRLGTFLFFNSGAGTGITIPDGYNGDIDIVDVGFTSISTNALSAITYTPSSNIGNSIRLTRCFFGNGVSGGFSDGMINISNCRSVILDNVSFNTGGSVSLTNNQSVLITDTYSASNITVTGNSMVNVSQSNINGITGNNQIFITNSMIQVAITANGTIQILSCINVYFTNATGLSYLIDLSSYVIGSLTLENIYLFGTVSPISLVNITTGGIGMAKIGLIVNPNAKTIVYPAVSQPSTPSVPASGTAQQNTNPYAVNVYIYGGDITEIQITRGGTAYTVLSVSTAIAMSGQSYRLNPGDSITLTYSTAPSWEWLAE